LQAVTTKTGMTISEIRRVVLTVLSSFLRQSCLVY